MTLFALLTGDDIHDTFNDIVKGGYPLPLVSRIYIFSFCIIFITTVLNVFIFIIEDAYQSSKINLGLIDTDKEGVWKQKSVTQVLTIVFKNLDNWQERMNARAEQGGPGLIQMHDLAEDSVVLPVEEDVAAEQLADKHPRLAEMMERRQQEFMDAVAASVARCQEDFARQMQADLATYLASEKRSSFEERRTIEEMVEDASHM